MFDKGGHQRVDQGRRLAGGAGWAGGQVGGALTLNGSDGRVDLGALLGELARRGINELHVEAGPRLAGALMARGLVDELLLYLAPGLIGDSGRGLISLPAPASLSDRVRLRWHDIPQVGADLRLIARLD